jgi:hypothetical protein
VKHLLIFVDSFPVWVSKSDILYEIGNGQELQCVIPMPGERAVIAEVYAMEL